MLKLLKYALIFVVSTIIVYKLAPIFGDEQKTAEVKSDIEEIFDIKKLTDVASSVFSDDAPVTDDGKGVQHIEIAESPTPPPAKDKRTQTKAEPPSQKSKPQEIAQQPTIVTYAPSLGVIPESPAPVIAWGIVMTDASAYRTSGKHLKGPAPGGTLVEISKFLQTKDGGEVASCYLERDTKWYGPFLISSDKILLFDGTREGVRACDVKSLSDYYAVLTAIEKRKKELDKAVVDKNPYAAELRKLAAEYNNDIATSQDLTKKRDAATGSKRIKYSEELRKRQHKQAELGKKIKDLTKKYESWKSNHPQTNVDYSSDGTYRRLDNALKKIYPHVKEIIPAN